MVLSANVRKLEIMMEFDEVASKLHDGVLLNFDEMTTCGDLYKFYGWHEDHQIIFHVKFSVYSIS